jgi:hypothetical protein
MFHSQIRTPELIAAPIMRVMWKSPRVTRADMCGGDEVRWQVELEEVIHTLQKEHIDVSQDYTLFFGSW